MWIKLFASGAESKLHHNSYLAKMSKLKPVLLCQQSDRQSAKEKLLEHAQGTGKPIHVHDAPQLIKGNLWTPPLIVQSTHMKLPPQ